jgi:hypothetical protein
LESFATKRLPEKRQELSLSKPGIAAVEEIDPDTITNKIQVSILIPL